MKYRCEHWQTGDLIWNAEIEAESEEEAELKFEKMLDGEYGSLDNAYFKCRDSGT